MSVTALIINFNAGQSLQPCVQALIDSSVKPQILVLDNASSDDSAVNLKSLYGSFPGLEIVFNPSNMGFAKAVNIAVRQSSSDQVLVINPDCVIAPNALEILQSALSSDNKAALAAPPTYIAPHARSPPIINAPTISAYPSLANIFKIGCDDSSSIKKHQNTCFVAQPHEEFPLCPRAIRSSTSI